MLLNFGLSGQAIAGILAVVIAIWLITSLGASAVAVVIVGPRRRAALIRPSVATLVCLPILMVAMLYTAPSARGFSPFWLAAALGLLAVPFGVAGVQRFVLDPGAADRVPRRWRVLAGGLIGGGAGVVALLLVLAFGEAVFIRTVPIGPPLGMAPGWRLG